MLLSSTWCVKACTMVLSHWPPILTAESALLRRRGCKPARRQRQLSQATSLRQHYSFQSFSPYCKTHAACRPCLDGVGRTERTPTPFNHVPNFHNTDAQCNSWNGHSSSNTPQQIHVSMLIQVWWLGNAHSFLPPWKIKDNFSYSLVFFSSPKLWLWLMNLPHIVRTYLN